MSDEQSERERFEKWISGAPYERRIERIPENTTWAGQYYDLNVKLAWEAWKEALINKPIPQRATTATVAQIKAQVKQVRRKAK